MAIEFKHGGRVWRADTVEEAVKLRKRLEAEDAAALECGEIPDHLTEAVWTPDKVMDLLRNIGRQQKMFLKALVNKNTSTSTEVIKKLELKSEESFAGVLSGLSKQLGKLGMKPWDLYTVQVEWDGKSKTRSFQLANNFGWVAQQLGWPDKWEG
jgi:hypothetical protein